MTNKVSRHVQKTKLKNNNFLPVFHPFWWPWVQFLCRETQYGHSATQEGPRNFYEQLFWGRIIPLVGVEQLRKCVGVLFH